MQNPRYGFTLVEILIALSILAIILTITYISFSRVAERASLDVSTQEVLSALQDARSDTLSSRNDSLYGVHVSSTVLVYFVGPTYVAGAATNVSYPLSRGVTATSSLTANTTELLFDRLTGDASATGTITVTENTSGASSTITVYQSGLLEL